LKGSSSSRAGPRRTSLRVELARRAAFVFVNTGLVAAGAFGWSRIYSVLADEFEQLFVPLFVLAIPVSFALHMVVLRLRSHFARAFALYVAFVALLLAYTEYLIGHTPGPWYWYIAVLGFGHALGLPVLVIAGAVNKLLSPVLCPRPV
jgi:hypothetical protein